MKYQIVERKPEFDEELLNTTYWGHVQAILEVIEARRKLGAKIYKRLENEVLRNIVYDMAEGWEEYWIKFLALEEGCFSSGLYGFEIYRSMQGVHVENQEARLCKAFLLPDGNKEYLSYMTQQFLEDRELASGYVESARMKKLTEEILPPMIEWMGGQCETLDDGMAIKVRLKEDKRFKTYGQCDISSLGYRMKRSLTTFGIPGGDCEYERFWHQFFQLGRNLDDDLLRKLNVRIVLGFNCDRVEVSGVGSATGGGSVEATLDGLGRLRDFVQELRRAAEGL